MASDEFNNWLADEAPPSFFGINAPKDDWNELLPFQVHSKESIDAAKSMKQHAVNLREKVFTAIANEPLGATDSELEELTGLGGSTVRPRRVELQRAGRIESCGTRATASGRQSKIWRVKHGT